MAQATSIAPRLLIALILLMGENSVADEPEPRSPFNIDGTLRNRFSIADWFEPAGGGLDSSYAYGDLKYQAGVGYTIPGFKAYFQGQYSQIINAPSSGTGIGDAYYRTNSNRSTTGDVLLREGYVQLSDEVFGGVKLCGTVGRFGYHGGNEVSAEDKGLDWLKRQRISDRLLGTFDFTFGRSYDGLRLDANQAEMGTLTLFASRPTYGGFETDGMNQITDITAAAASFTASPSVLGKYADIQFFYYFYDDDRQDNVLKTDNRPEDVRRADQEVISIHTFGAHGVKRYETGQDSVDTLVWTALQSGSWGEEDHFAAAFAIEAGYRFEQLHGKPWFRGGWNYGTGDSNPNDRDHGTFFQMLPTARLYAQTPFYNLMNSSDFLVQMIWQAWQKGILRSDVHVIYLADRDDLLYSGGGAAKESNQFGFNGLPSGSERYVGTLWDIGVSFPLLDYLDAGVYYGHLFGGDVPQAAFPGGRSEIDYGYVELTAKF